MAPDETPITRPCNASGGISNTTSIDTPIKMNNTPFSQLDHSLYVHIDNQLLSPMGCVTNDQVCDRVTMNVWNHLRVPIERQVTGNRSVKSYIREELVFDQMSERFIPSTFH
jgi:hypothetical protein